MSGITKTLLYYNTLKYLRPVQVYGRLFSLLKEKTGFSKLPSIPAKLYPGLKNKTKYLNHDPWNSSEEIIRGKITFLNLTMQLGYPVKWNDAAGLTLLWQFNLHYFNYIHLLPETEQEEICLQWANEYSYPSGTAWHPYVVSLRIINWCKAGLRNEGLNQCLYKQAAYLYRHLEFYHPANHYLENARALILAGLYFNNMGESEKWLNKGLSIYQKELPVQLLKDGCYFERSMMYHAIMLEGFLDIINVLPSDNKYYSLFCNAAELMLRFLINTTHPDCKISLFNDSTTEIAPAVSKLLNYAKQLGLKFEETPIVNKIMSFSDSGYYSFRNENIFFIMDGGKIGPDNIPAHAHADIFSYELSVKGEQFIIDTGVYEYQAGPMRDYVRSTKAHNTVSIDGKNQSEVWGGFRVARRYDPQITASYENNNIVYFEGIYGGYAKLIGDNLIHKRFIEINKKNAAIIITDEVKGKGEHKVESYVHLHPEVKITTNKSSLILEKNGISVAFSSVNQYTIEGGYHFPEFGKKIPNKVIKISSSVPANLSYTLKLL